MNQNKKIEKFTDNLFFKSQRSRSPIPSINFHFKKLPTLKCQKVNTTRSPQNTHQPIPDPQSITRRQSNRKQFRQSREQIGLSKNDIDKLELMCADLNGEDYLAKLIELHEEERINRNEGNLEEIQYQYQGEGIDDQKGSEGNEMKILENSQNNILQSKNSACELIVPNLTNDQVNQNERSSPKKSYQSITSNNNQYNIKISVNVSKVSKQKSKQKQKQKRCSLTKRITRNNNNNNTNLNNNNGNQQKKSKQFVFVRTARSINKNSTVKYDHKRSQSSTLQIINSKNKVKEKAQKIEKQKTVKNQQSKKSESKKQRNKKDSLLIPVIKNNEIEATSAKDTPPYARSAGVASVFRPSLSDSPQKVQPKQQHRYYNQIQIPKNKKLQQICYSQIGKRMVTVTQKQIHRQFFKTNLHIRAYIMRNIVSYIQSLAEYSPNSIFILPNQRALHFQANMKPQQLQNYLQHTKYVQIIKNVNHIIQKNIYKQKYQQGQPSYWAYTLIAMFVIFIVLMFSIIFLASYDIMIKNALIIGTGFIICVILVMLIGYSLHCFGMKTEFVPVCQIIYQDIDSYFKYVNGKMENQLEWVVGESFFWLEVKINNGCRAKKQFNQLGDGGQEGQAVNRRVFKRTPTRHKFYHQNIDNQVNQPHE